MSTTPTQAQALIWPQLLYAMAQVAGRPGDKECCGWIWATAPDADHIKLAGCLAMIGWAYFDDGYAAGKLAVRVLKVEPPANMAFEPLTKTE